MFRLLFMANINLVSEYCKVRTAFCIWLYKISLICANTVATQNLWFFQEKRLEVLKCYNFLSVQQRHNCSPAASFANSVMTLYLLKVHLQTFLSVPITQKCQIVWHTCRKWALYICIILFHYTGGLNYNILWELCSSVLLCSCIITVKSTVFSYFAAEAWNHRAVFLWIVLV